MPHTDTTIYRDTANNLGVSDTDIQVVLRCPQIGIGKLITYGDINKSAKNKPIRSSSLAPLTANDRANANYGLSITSSNSLGSPSNSNTFLGKLLAGQLGWEYLRPRGKSYSEYFRRRDFDGYDHAAPKPVGGVSDTLRVYGGGKLNVLLDTSRSANSSGVELSDIIICNSSVSDWYYGVLIYKNANTYQFAFSDDTIGNGADSVDFTNMTSYGGQNATIVPFLSSVRASQGNDPGAGLFISCDVDPDTFTIRAEVPDVTMSINAQWRESLHLRVHYDVRIFNNTGTQITVNNLSIALYDGSQNQDVDNVGTVTVAANDFHEESGTLFCNLYSSDYTYKVVVSSSRSEVNGEVVVDEPRT